MDIIEKGLANAIASNEIEGLKTPSKAKELILKRMRGEITMEEFAEFVDKEVFGKGGDQE